jgi:3-oxoacyl-(acyl-carrier-protein) synthase
MSAHSADDGRRPVVTGAGVVAPNGVGAPAFWRAILERRSGIVPISLFDASKLRTRIAGEVRGFDPRELLPPGTKWRRLARHTRFALAAMEMALRDAGLRGGALTPASHVAIAMGVGTSAVEIMELAADNLRSGRHDRMEPWIVTSSQPHAVAVALAATLGTRVSLVTVSTDCQAGLDAILAAAAEVRAGRAEIAIAGGTDAPISPSTFASFDAVRMNSERNDDPAHASRPFDRDRDGGVLAEGAGVVVIESLAHARARGATPMLEILGGASFPDPAGAVPGTGLTGAMALALANARLHPTEIDYVCAHGPSHPVIDRIETAAIREVFGPHAYRMPVSSIKGVIGNPLAAAGPLQAIACGLAMRDGLVPPTANYVTPDPDCDLDYVPEPRRGRIGRVLVNVHGVGGGNGVLALGRPDL